MKWEPIETAPRSGRGLIYFSPSGHIEDADFHEDDEGDWYYVLFDGEVLDVEPTHWMPRPEDPK
jgi:hypothetical protein